MAGKVQAVIEVFPAKPGRRSRNVIMFMERKVTLAQAKKRAKAGTLNQLRFKFRRSRPNVMIPGSFVATANRGTFVARRTGKSRLPIKAVHVIDIPQMAGARRVLKDALAKIEKQYLPEEVERAIRAALKRFGR